MALLIDQILAADNLREAWNEVAENQGIPGVDHVSVLCWRRTWEERLVNLARDVRTNRYKSSPLHMLRIPKKQSGEWRTLRIPTVTDRVLQRATYQILCPLFERVFLDCSFGYRPGRGLLQAVERILSLRSRGMAWVLDADIDAFFDNVDQGLLLERVEEQVNDPIVLGLLENWLAAGCTRCDTAIGIPMGSPISPLLANIYLHPLDWYLVRRRWQIVRYADDFLVLTESQTAAKRAYGTVGYCLGQLKLQYEPSKTRLVSFNEGFDFVGVHFYRDTYSYLWQNKHITVEGDEMNWLFSTYGPHYE